VIQADANEIVWGMNGSDEEGGRKSRLEQGNE